MHAVKVSLETVEAGINYPLGSCRNENIWKAIGYGMDSLFKVGWTFRVDAEKNIDGFRILKGASRHQNIDLLDTVCILWSVDYA